MIKNKVIVRDDIALISVIHDKKEQFVIMDAEKAFEILPHLENTLSLCTSGFPQARNRKKGVMDQYLSLHRLVVGAKDGEVVRFVNGNPLDLRENNLLKTSR